MFVSVCADLVLSSWAGSSQSAARLFLMCFFSHVLCSLVFPLQEKQDSSSTSLQLRSEIQVRRETVLRQAPASHPSFMYLLVGQWSRLDHKKWP